MTNELSKQLPVLAVIGCGLCLLGWEQPPQMSPESATCLSNEKQLSIGTLMYVQDYDEMFPRKNASYKETVYPYIKNLEVFHCPLDPKGVVSYTFNPSVQGTLLAKVKSPAQTVLLYEGKNMQMEFRHEGKAAVAFVDGHARLLTPDEAKNVFWYPGGKTPAPDVKLTGKNKSKPKK